MTKSVECAVISAFIGEIANHHVCPLRTADATVALTI